MPYKPENKKCAACGGAFETRKRAKYCSRRCIWVGTKGPEYNARLAARILPSRNIALRGTGTKGYVKENGRHQHRIVAERILGRSLGAGEVVHHIDGNKHNNAPENLTVTTQALHMREHGLGIPGVAPHWKPWEKRNSRG